jgi:carboxyl-terminal processing protease
MPIRTPFIQTLVTFSALLALTTSIAHAKSLKEFWNETNLGVDNLKGAVYTTNCYVNDKQFQACVAALRALAGAARSQSTILAPEFSAQAKNCTPIESFGPLTWCEMAERANPQLKPAAAIAKRTADLLADNEAMRKTRDVSAKPFERCMAFSQGRDPQTCLKRSPSVDFDSAVDHIWAEVKKQRADALPLAAGIALNAFMNVVFDPHTDFKPVSLMKENLSGTQSFVGIGITIGTKDDKVVIASLVEGGPAHLAGLRPRDIIQKIDRTAVKAPAGNMEDALKRLKGAEGSAVRLELLRGGQTLEITVVRKPIVTKNVQTKVIESQGHKIGYLRLNVFSDDACAPVKAGLTELKEQKVESLVFDLRDNRGGSLSQALCIGGLFVGKKVIVKVQDQDSDKQQELRSEQEKMFDLPMVTLINALSASASELVSGALQDYQRSWIAGARSFGKGSVQINQDFKEFFFFQWMRALFPSEAAHQTTEGVKNLSLSFTIQRFFQPTGRTNQSVGITPDIALDPFPGATDDDKVAFREENLYTNALPPLGKPWVQPRPQDVAAIESCMASTGKADTLYAQRKDDVIPPDYQVLKAQDLLTCVKH